MTNRDKLMQESNEQLARDLYHSKECWCCAYSVDTVCCCNCEEGIKKWLESEVKE